MLQEAADLGFRHVELSHGIRIPLVPGILRGVEAGLVEITSVHNFCPLPTGVERAAPNFYQPSAPDRREWDQWVRHTQRTIDFAAQVRARVVVCHLGSVAFSWFNPVPDLNRYLDEYPEAGRAPGGDPKYEALLSKSCARLRKRMPEFWDRVRAGIREVIGYAGTKGVKLGFENRERFEELPVDVDFPSFLGEFGADAPVGYWHDTGHADIKEGMGLLQHEGHLAAMAAWTLGFHLHDVDGDGHDHRPLGAGRVDFEMISRYWRPEHLLTLELSPRVAVDDVIRSRERVESLLAKVV